MDEGRNKAVNVFLQSAVSYIRANGRKIFKFSVFLAAALFVVVLMPKSHSFKYDFNKGQEWRYDDLNAPFDFALVKTDEQLRAERELIRTTNRYYFVYSDTLAQSVVQKFDDNFEAVFPGEGRSGLRETGRNVLRHIMRKGLVSDASAGVLRSRNELVSLIKGKEEHEAIFSEFYTIKSAFEYIDRKITGIPQEDMEKLTSLFEAVITPNVAFDMDLTETALAEKLDGISPNYGFVARGKHIISKGEPVSEYTYTVLSSLRRAYNMQSSDTHGRWNMTLGYVIVIFIIFISLYGLIKIFKKGKYFHDKPMVLIVFNMLASFVMCYIVTRFSPLMIYIVPLCMQTIILRSFFNARIAFMVHLFTVFICSFMAPNIYMYIFVGTITGIACSFTSNVIYHRSRLFVSVARITALSISVAAGVMLVQNSSFTHEMLSVSGYLLISGVLMLFAQPVIYVYEKIFGLVSDISLLELTDTNSPLLRLLSQKAPGTFQHSLSVANIAEQAAHEMAANSLLVRVGALYHDVGKLKNPGMFIENQGGHFNPHDNMSPEESARIIRNHVSDGLELAKKYGIPSIVSEFMRTHHGHSLVFYFYKKAVEMYGQENVNPDDYRYDYRKPVSKEEAILMICDSVEAASRSLKTITEKNISELVAAVVERQTKDGQFDDAEISYREINRLKVLLTEKLLEIYHSRIEYQAD